MNSLSDFENIFSEVSVDSPTTTQRMFFLKNSEKENKRLLTAAIRKPALDIFEICLQHMPENHLSERRIFTVAAGQKRYKFISKTIEFNLLPSEETLEVLAMSHKCTVKPFQMFLKKNIDLNFENLAHAAIQQVGKNQFKKLDYFLKKGDLNFEQVISLCRRVGNRSLKSVQIYTVLSS